MVCVPCGCVDGHPREVLTDHMGLMLSQCSTSGSYTRLLHSQYTAETPWTDSYSHSNRTGVMVIAYSVWPLYEPIFEMAQRYKRFAKHSYTSSLCTQQRDHEPQACRVFSCNFMCTNKRLILTATVYIFSNASMGNFSIFNKYVGASHTLLPPLPFLLTSCLYT